MGKSRTLILWTSAAVAIGVLFSCVGYHLSTAAEVGEGPSEVLEPVDTPFAVVELFTSEGCSSCPPADRLLVELSERSTKPGSRLYPLVFHVDYWDDLGWPDRFAEHRWSERQRSYAAAWRTSRVYTPQAVVNGVDEFVGNGRGAMVVAVQRAMQRPAEASVSLSAVPRGGVVRVDYEASGRLSRAVLQVAVVQQEATTRVPRGENRGRTLRHANVVRDLRTVSLAPSATGTLDLRLEDTLDLSSTRVIAFVQDAGSMAIRGAASVQPHQGRATF